LGTEITLDIGKLALTYSKNQVGPDHGMLFQAHDRQRVRSDQIDYDWHAEHEEDPAPMEMAFSRPLRQVVPRIELLGFTLGFGKIEYDRAVQAWSEDYQRMSEGENDPVPTLMSFEEFCSFASEHAVEDLDNTYVESHTDELRRGRFREDARIQRIPYFDSADRNAYSERSYFGGLIEILHPYSLLRVLALNRRNLDSAVLWQYGPLVDAGWADSGQFMPEARRTQTFLIATEGSSDVHILKHALSLLRPEIFDFFRFIDVNESHPFSGAGNLLKFAEGLVKIDVHNQLVFVFDNDAEGRQAHQRLSRLQLPSNMRAMLLPDLPELRSFAALGPEGPVTTDINGRAAGIECYLDLTFEETSSPTVRWTNYKSEIDAYQGALEDKERYTKGFMKQTAKSLAAGRYDSTKLGAVLEALVAQCSAMRTAIVAAEDPFEVERG
jgi:HEPN/Toprim N-terminal domain 1